MVSFYPGQKANELAKVAQERFERAVEDLKREEAATNKLAEEHGQLQLNVIRSTIKRFVTFLENSGRKASESEKRLLEGIGFFSSADEGVQSCGGRSRTIFYGWC